jgi:SAM-dependent methyltransferase
MHPVTRLLNKIQDPTLARLTLMEELKARLPLIKPGATLDVGGGRAPYRKLVPHTEYLTLDVDPKKKPDILCDLHRVDWSSEYFDTIVATEVLEHLRDPRTAVGEMYRLLKDGGVCLLSTRFIHPIHGSPMDFYRFTADGLRHLFSDFAEVEVVPLGNRIQALWLLLTHNHIKGKKKRLMLLLMPITRLLARVKVDDTLMPLGYLVVARKRAKAPSMATPSANN